MPRKTDSNSEALKRRPRRHKVDPGPVEQFVKLANLLPWNGEALPWPHQLDPSDKHRSLVERVAAEFVRALPGPEVPAFYERFGEPQPDGTECFRPTGVQRVGEIVVGEWRWQPADPVEVYGIFRVVRGLLEFIARAPEQNATGAPPIQQFLFPGSSRTVTISPAGGVHIGADILVDGLAWALKGRDVRRIKPCLECRRLFWARRSHARGCSQRCCNLINQTRKRHPETKDREKYARYRREEARVGMAGGSVASTREKAR